MSTSSRPAACNDRARLMPPIPPPMMATFISRRARLRLPSLSRARLHRVEPCGFENQCSDRGFIHGITLSEVDGPDRPAIQPGVEELLRVVELGTVGKGQPHGTLERLADADDSVMGPNRYALWP